MRDYPVCSEDLLHWYDIHAREMPWRVPPHLSKAGKRPDPYHIWMSEVMLQQTTVAAVKKYFLDFTSRWPNVHSLAAAEDAEVMGAWAGLGYYARARNLLKCARYVSEELDGVFPEDTKSLLKLPGVGPYTAGAIAAIAFDHPAAVVDANVERVMARIFAVKEPLPDSKETLRAHAENLTPDKRAGDYAQAVMDLGATICSQNPTCGICPWSGGCDARAEGIAAELPKKRPKAAKPTRQGTVYFVERNDGAILLETRPEKGLLGGMLGFPGTEWSIDTPAPKPPINAEWIKLSETVRHTFTHFHLVLTVMVAEVDETVDPKQGKFVEYRKDLAKTLPTVMRKVFSLVTLNSDT